MSDKKDHFTEEDREPRDGPPMDNPEQYKTDKKTINEMYEEELTVDAVPSEELKQDMEDEKHRRSTKDNSSSEEKYPGS
ncbi:hypothetical protein [Planococcus salinus]|uniref:Uncharacterized protein n=1 Tax=Planococcus salinus TaxID=1848460 RepID=A0A3M8P8Y9_9BACL|nr:hypothetical protein [Planococcus salinus]RNF40137.1 hypothetical protein EEX84_05730 [Planococcus salinus]